MGKCKYCNREIKQSESGRHKIYCSDSCKMKAYRKREKRNDYNIQDVTKLNHIYCMDALDFLKNLPNESVKLFITSPPYNLANSTGGFWRAKSAETAGRWGNSPLRTGYDTHSDNMSRRDYVKWQKNCLEEMLRAIRPDGAIFYNHKPRVQGGLMESPHEIVSGFPVRQVIIWNRGRGFNFNDTYFVSFHEYIYLICKPDFRLKQGACGLSDVWNISPESGNDHPAPFPVELPDRVLQSVDMDGHYVCDPFGGSGTVAISAIKNNIDYKLNDISPLYVEQARQRIREGVQIRLAI